MKNVLCLLGFFVFGCMPYVPPEEPTPEEPVEESVVEVEKPAPPPSAEDYMAQWTANFGPGWQESLEALDSADAAYHLISDTPIAELEARSEEIGMNVTAARDLWRKAKSYNLEGVQFSPNLNLKGYALFASSWKEITYKNGYRDSEENHPLFNVRSSVGNSVFVPIKGHTLKYQIVLSQPVMIARFNLSETTTFDTIYTPIIAVYIVSSRQKVVAQVKGNEPSDHDLGVSNGAFDSVLSTDQISIPDLIVRIKR